VVLVRRTGGAGDRDGRETVTARPVKDVLDRRKADVLLEPDDVVMVRTGAPPAAQEKTLPATEPRGR
jgi:hypothetical protein